MNIIVAGSTDFAEGEQVHEEFVSACKDLGASLAKAGHTIVVGSDAEKTADRHVVFGANSSGEQAKVVIIDPLQGEAPFDPDREQLSNLNLSYRRSRGSWAAGRIRQILEADGVITIGGGRGTAQLGYTAPALERPVLAIPAFGGASRDLWDEYVDQDLDRLNFYRPGFLDGRVRTLSQQWDASKADLAVKVMEKLVKQNPYSSQRIVPQWLMVTVHLILLTGWIMLFVKPFDPTVSFFLLLGISALLGTGIRTSLSFLMEIRPRIFVRRVVAEGMMGLLLAFALALFYLLGVYTVTGDPNYVMMHKTGDFQRIAVNMSLLGLAAGALLERTTEQVMRRLETVVSKDE